VHFLDFNKNEQKQSPHINYNPNGRIPTLVDRNNNDFPVWESNAILLYLMDQYDPENKSGFMGSSSEEKAQVIQWLFFQASGQGGRHQEFCREESNADITCIQAPTTVKLIGFSSSIQKRYHPQSKGIRMRYSGC
jgi:glutathione S-transferase